MLFCATYNQHQWENYPSPQLCNKMHSFKKERVLAGIKSRNTYPIFNIPFPIKKKKKKTLTCKSRFDEWNSMQAASPVSLCHGVLFLFVESCDMTHHCRSPFSSARVCYMAWIWCCFPQVASGPRFIKISPNHRGSKDERIRERFEKIS